MRYATIVIRSDEGGLHPVDWALYTDPAVTRETIQKINLLNDGTFVVLYELSGDLMHAKELLSEHPDVITADVTGEEAGLAYIHLEGNFTVKALLTIVQMFEFVLDTPIKCTQECGVRVRLIGDDATIQTAIATILNPLQVTLEANSDYDPTLDDVFASLTSRQREILTIAVEEGYYQIPRRVTIEEIADALSLDSSTVGEHLQKIEACLVQEMVGPRL
ncbi:helix-turn-helix domain-containing protein [Natrinema soli]|uniref:Helix-turn-helix domain-containing protein n=1 Tax=Natrinema soli TaxID=1930624 RepID=A0ABD5SME9_9EURY|nr:helix-turn-helix domain-containing protein [Natrinema soli]